MRKATILPRLLMLLVIATLFVPSVVAQSTTRRIPTAPQVAIQSKAKSKKGVMRGTTQYARWQAAIKNADRRAAQVRTGQKGGE
jgi:hypothetical protein